MMMWTAHPGPQTNFLNSRADEVLYGGAAGGGKSEALLAEALRYTRVPGYRALLLRRSYPELEGKGSGLIPRSMELLKEKAKYDRQRNIWTFPSGATLGFGHLEHASSVFIYHSAQFAYIGFDELTTFLESQYLYMLSRCRSVAGVPARVRAASNPGGIGHTWVRRRFIEKLKAGERRWFKRDGDLDVETVATDPDALSRQFIPARVYDNPTLLERDPGYIRRLKALDPIDRQRLLDGDWWVANSGTVYGEFTDDNLTDQEPDPARPIELGFDDGYIDPRALLLIQRSGTQVLVFDELYHTHHLGEVCIAEIVELCKRRGLPAPELAVGSPEAVEFRQYLRRAEIVARSEKTPIVEGIKVVRRLISDSQGVRSLKVHRRCRHLLNEIQGGYQYPSLDANRDSEQPLDQDNHAVDALRYWVWMRARR
jgi:hypothetical protein